MDHVTFNPISTQPSKFCLYLAQNGFKFGSKDYFRCVLKVILLILEHFRPPLSNADKVFFPMIFLDCINKMVFKKIHPFLSIF